MKTTNYFFYIVARDYGFAPNPFYNYCTLACCKAPMRKTAKAGDWIIGLGSKGLKCREKLIYTMKITEILTFNAYFKDPRFKLKKPIVKGSLKTMHGDNIYRKVQGKWIQSDSHHHHPDKKTRCANIRKDTKADKVLISDHFYYFGDKFIPLPKSIIDETENLRPGYKYDNEDIRKAGEKFIQKIIKKYRKNTLHSNPINWEEYREEIKKIGQDGF